MSLSDDSKHIIQTVLEASTRLREHEEFPIATELAIIAGRLSIILDPDWAVDRLAGL